MKTFNVLLSSINDVKNFVNTVSKYDYDIDSLDLSKPIKVEIHNDDCDKLADELKPYIQ